MRATVQELEDIEPPPKPKPIPPMARVAKVVNKKRVDARRVNEDRRNRVPSYFIEDDDY